MKNFSSAIKMKGLVDSLHESIKGINVSDIGALFPVLSAEYAKAFINVRALFTEEDPALIMAEETEAETENKNATANTTTETVSNPNPWVIVNPTAKWRKYDGTQQYRMFKGFMISSEGDIWDIEKECLVYPTWIAGDMRLKIPKSYYYKNTYPESAADPIIRVAVMVTKAFGIRSESTIENPIHCTIKFIDGDRRNIKPRNLRWVRDDLDPSSGMQPMTLTTIDICQRLVEFNGDVDKTFELYKDEPAVSRKYIEDIRNKLIQFGISDNYFLIDTDGSFVPKANTVDGAEYYENTHDAKMAKKLILDKIDRKEVLSEGEKKFLLAAKIDEIKAAGKRKRNRLSAEIIVDEIRDETGAIISTDLARTALTENGGK